MQREDLEDDRESLSHTSKLCRSRRPCVILVGKRVELRLIYMVVRHRSTCSRHPVRSFLYQTLGRRSSSTVLQVLPASGTVLSDRGISGNPSRSAQHAEVYFDELRRELLGLPEVAVVYVVAGSKMFSFMSPYGMLNTYARWLARL